MGFLTTLLGGSKQKNESGNKAFSTLSPMLTPAVNTGVNALTRLGDIMSGGFDDFSKNAGIDFASILGSRGITNNAAAKGMLNSGATAKALQDRQTGINGQFYNNWLDRIGQVGQLGLGAGQLLAGAGSYSKGSGSQSNGIIPGLSSLFG